MDESVPAEPGAYLLLIELGRPLRLEIRTLPRVTLAPGRYAYCGSAHGSGGLRARIGRHLRQDKAVHWHIDRLTAVAPVRQVRAMPGARECDLLAGLLKWPGTAVPVPGFGSSDCRRCPAHLLALPDAAELDAIVPVARCRRFR